MRYYQCKNRRKLLYAYLVLHLFAYGFPGMVFTFNLTGENSQDLVAGIFFLIIALIGIAAPIYMKINGRFERTIEFTKEEIIYRAKNRTIKMKWDDVRLVELNPYSIFISWNRAVIFSASRDSINWKNLKLSDKLIWSEINSQMLREINRYWKGAIINQNYYKKYMNISPSGDYKFKQIFGNDDNRYFRFKIRPNALIYDEGDYLPKFITNEVYYTRFTTIFGWGENDTLWIYSSDTGIDYWEIEDGSWTKKRADEESIGFAPERIKEVYLDNRKDEVEM